MLSIFLYFLIFLSSIFIAFSFISWCNSFIYSLSAIVSPVLFDLNDTVSIVKGVCIIGVTYNSITFIIWSEEDIDDIFAIVIAWSNAVSDSFELSYGTSILYYVNM